MFVGDEACCAWVSMFEKAAPLNMVGIVGACSRRTRLLRLRYGIRLLTIRMANDTHEKGKDGTDIHYLKI
jgi:hypothetical protein